MCIRDSYDRNDVLRHSVVRQLDAEDATTSIVVPAALEMVGVIQSDAERAVPAAEVRIYSAIQDSRGRAIELGRGRTDQDGVFAISVPELSE